MAGARSTRDVEDGAPLARKDEYADRPTGGGINQVKAGTHATTSVQ
jgi:hypothetical protein